MSEVDARAPWADRKAPLLARLIAMGRYIYWEGWRKTSIRAPYGEVSFGALMLAVSLGNFGRPHLHVAVPGVQVFFRLPRWGFLERLTCKNRGYGFSWRFGHDWQGDLHWDWGKRNGIRRMPWGWNTHKDDYRREYLATNGLFYSHEQFPYDWRTGADRGPDPFLVSQPYPYLTSRGQFQDDITATANLERTHMVYRVFGFPVKRETRYTINVQFDNEVGSERGSWKGGVVGCTYDMKPGETISETLNRMRRERSFCR